jgi:hypothetical protein
MASYERLSLDETSHGSSEFLEKVLIAEKTLSVKAALGTNTTILMLKEAVTAGAGELEPSMNLPPTQQRLLWRGRQLQPDNKILEDFSITEGNAVMHCFPRLVASSPTYATAVPTSSPAGTPVALASAASVDHTSQSFAGMRPWEQTVEEGEAGQNGNRGTLENPARFDEYVQMAARDVRMWCFILLFVSATTTFNNISFWMTEHHLGRTALDTFVLTLQTVCGIFGIQCAQLGQKSLLTSDVQLVKS